ncbi:antitoxin YezG family protein [Oceanobacillus sp. CFH 90083]|uniref:antitoxin YezG family protein n=1 Tax=Oceanobacillus sp. CFH 90083 TaxID=2592336 RepID=UPI00128BC7DF|nr:antitoxin YezG family protein [Oceanobacillus sp. CFH 90083]
MEKEMNQIYREIADTVNEMIPEEWEKFYFYGQVSETGGGTYFFYNTSKESNSFYYSLDIPSYFAVNNQEFKEKKRKLYRLCKDLRRIFKENEQDLWYSFTMSLEKTGKLKIHYDYTDWFATDYHFGDQMIIWKYKYLGEERTDEKAKKVLERYFRDFPDNPI